MSPTSQAVAAGPWRSLLPVFAACAAIGLQAGTAMPLVPLALERMGHDKLTIGIVAAAWGVGMLATALAHPAARGALGRGAVHRRRRRCRARRSPSPTP